MNVPFGTPLPALQATTDERTNGGNKIKEGRHVGLDFYDLLIEALIDPPSPQKRF